MPLDASEPVLVLEILSPTTRTFDRNDKLEEYKTIPALEYNLLVDPNYLQAHRASRHARCLALPRCRRRTGRLTKIRAAQAMRASGNMPAGEVARQLGCAASTLYRHLPGGRAGIERVDRVAARSIYSTRSWPPYGRLLGPLTAHRRPHGQSVDQKEPVPEYVPEQRERCRGKSTRPVDSAGETQSDHGGEAGHSIMGRTVDTRLRHQAQTPEVTSRVHL
jgi:hypothetical protein